MALAFFGVLLFLVKSGLSTGNASGAGCFRRFADTTNRTILEYPDRGVEVLSVKERKGMESAQRVAVQHARLDPDGLRKS
jgi:hypothetical protein